MCDTISCMCNAIRTNTEAFARGSKRRRTLVGNRDLSCSFGTARVHLLKSCKTLRVHSCGYIYEHLSSNIALGLNITTYTATNELHARRGMCGVYLPEEAVGLI